MLQPPLPGALCRQFSLSEIKTATYNFSNDLIIGKGSFGNVYKATIATGATTTTTVAVKRRKSDSKQGPQEFWTEIKLLSAFRHTNLISLIGYCVEEDANEMILVYEYMANGTLADHIYKNNTNSNSSCLSWEQRLKICIGVGRGLEYLHTGTGINQMVIHRDFKSSNILLDSDFVAKISDFGLCKTCSGDRLYSPIITSVKGTAAYMDPNYRKTHELSTKCDVYAFGVVLLEVFSGRRSMDFEVADLQKRLVLWAQQCHRERVVHRVIDPSLWGRITDEGLQIFLDIAMKCLQDRPDKRPTMVEVVAKLEHALASQYTSYCSSSSDDDEFVKIYFGHAASSSANSDVDPVRYAVETGSGQSDTMRNRRFDELKSSSEIIGLEVVADLQSNKMKTDVSMRNTVADKVDECEKLFRRMNPPRAAVDNRSCEKATVIKVYSTNPQGILLEVIQVLTDFDLLVTKASRTSDGLWFMDVFNVTDQQGNKVTDKAKTQIEEVLNVYSSSSAPMGRNYKTSISENHTILELIGNDRPGLISEISSILTNFQCNVVSAETWSHKTRIATIMHLSDKETNSATIEPEKLDRIKKLLLNVLEGGNNNNRCPKVKVANGCSRFDRRLHEMMFGDRECESGATLNDGKRPKVDVVISYDKDYTAITIQCKNKPKVLFDTICTLTDLMYFVFHSDVYLKGSEVCMEFWIRHIDGSTIKSDAERQRVICHLEAAIERRVSEGLKLEIRAKDRVGLLSDVTRIIRESNLTITRAEVTTTGDKGVFVFYVDDNLGLPVDPMIINYIKEKIEQTILHHGKRNNQESVSIFNFKDFLKGFMGCFGYYHIWYVSLWGSPVTVGDVCMDYLL